jgi:hypothetical protein
LGYTGAYILGDFSQTHLVALLQIQTRGIVATFQQLNGPKANKSINQIIV